MSTPIETIDKLPQPLPHDRVNASGKANEEKDREAFKQALKRRMDRGQDAPGEESENLIVDVDLSKQDKQADKDNEPEVDTQESQQAEDKAESGDREESPGPPDHIDLKA